MAGSMINVVFLISITIAILYMPMGLRLLEAFFRLQSKCEFELMADEKSNNNSNSRCPTEVSASQFSSVVLLSLFLVIGGFITTLTTAWTFHHVKTNVDWSLLKQYAVMTTMIITFTWFFSASVYGSWKLKGDPRFTDDEELNEDEKEVFDFYHLVSEIFKWTVFGTILSYLALMPLTIVACSNASMERAEGGREDGDGGEEVISLQDL